MENYLIKSIDKDKVFVEKDICCVKVVWFDMSV